KAHEWVWFFLTFFFGAIVVFVYLFAGPQPLKAGQVPQQQLAGLPPNVPLANPAQPSALEMLRQRYVRGEIDEATFDRMRTRLEG
ncbi:MAG: SHOCT domain-containing protein, partial [Ktedonobacteraceae bacterium]|nr:SHOCT domain-containing protein [Ktedonobacteraceae bacterium]